jgi:hypothetical protein
MRSNSSLVSARRGIVWPHTALAALVGLLALNGCSAGLEEEADGPPDFSGQNPPVAGNQNPSATPVNTPGTNTGTSNTNGGEQTQGNGAPIAPSTNTGNANGAGGTSANNGSANTGGTGGAGMVGAAGSANVGAAGSAMGNAGAGTAPMTPPPQNGEQPPPVTPPPVTPPPVTTPTAPDTTCPAGAIFCSGFEGAGLPAGTTFEPDYLRGSALGTEVTLDTTVFHSGRQALKMPVGHNYYRMLAVPLPSNSFWVRLYTRSNVGHGAPNSTHASLFMASTLEPGAYNGDGAVEIAEQFGQVLLNVKDSLFGTSGTNPNGMPGTRLPDNTWTCMEAEFDGASGDVHVFVEGDEIIDASGWQPPTDFKTFRFGYLRFDSPARDVWMDDVVVASSRIGCL